jgi:hypothetical protein
MTRINERQSLTREEKFVALVHLYVELRLPFDAALDAAAADLFARSDKGAKETARRLEMSSDGKVGLEYEIFSWRLACTLKINCSLAEHKLFQIES